MNERIKQLRKEINISQEEFGKRIGIGKTSVSKIETGENSPSEQTIMLMCREFNVNEEWLRNGKGDMFINLTHMEKAYNRFGYIMENSPPSKKAALALLLELLYEVPDNKWNLIMEQYNEALVEAKKED
ncbi:helix-turn-helix transcriptional regulator [Blautia coccoides]|uniref:helix-turn-helix domain-containing protein n=1 Tax=Blautia producta TaxID=33035 RepID=UPI003516DF0B